MVSDAPDRDRRRRAYVFLALREADPALTRRQIAYLLDWPLADVIQAEKDVWYARAVTGARIAATG